MLSIGLAALSVMAAFGVAVALVEKGRTWPIRRFKLIITHLLAQIHPRATRMLNCAPCTSFWASFFTDLFVCLFSGFRYWGWPLTGFITFGFTWTVFQFLNGLDKAPIIIYPKSDSKQE